VDIRDLVPRMLQPGSKLIVDLAFHIGKNVKFRRHAEANGVNALLIVDHLSDCPSVMRLDDFSASVHGPLASLLPIVVLSSGSSHERARQASLARRLLHSFRFCLSSV